MKKAFLIFCVLLGCASIAQTTFQRTYSTQFSGAVWLRHMTPVENGCFLNIGSYRTFKTDALGGLVWQKEFGTHSLTDGGALLSGNGYYFIGVIWQHYVLIVTDTSGNVTMAKNFECPGNSTHTVCTITQDSTGMFVIAGTVIDSVNFKRSMFVIKADTSGSILWSRLLTDTTNNGVVNAHGLCVTPSGDIVVAGESDSCLFVVRMDPSGNIEWNNVYSASTPRRYFQVDIIATTDDGVLVSYSGVRNIKLDSNGNSVWARNYSITTNGQHFDSLSSCVRAAQLTNGNFLLSAAVYETNGTVPYLSLIEVDSIGLPVQAHYFTGDTLHTYAFTPTYTITEPIECGTSGYIVGAAARWPSTLDCQALVVRTDGNFNSSCSQLAYTIISSDETFTSVPVVYIDSGATTSVSAVASTNTNFLLGGCIENVQETGQSVNCDVQPNPSNTLFNFSAQGATSCQIYSASGELIEKFQVNSDTWAVDLSLYPCGMYFAFVETTTGTARATLIRR